MCWASSQKINLISLIRNKKEVAMMYRKVGLGQPLQMTNGIQTLQKGEEKTTANRSYGVMPWHTAFERQKSKPSMNDFTVPASRSPGQSLHSHSYAGNLTIPSQQPPFSWAGLNGSIRATRIVTRKKRAFLQMKTL